ncbi:hypothetical protein [Paenibacillus cremeus]|uniref:hypothetical protein n=1 Tax=Paenibacillus cremeus TaxID=2163881 RepID=UPI0016489A8F|nr:hypothetical protein [Paenibacillus cremeus]
MTNQGISEEELHLLLAKDPHAPSNEKLDDQPAGESAFLPRSKRHRRKLSWLIGMNRK